MVFNGVNGKKKKKNDRRLKNETFIEILGFK
jgi:hypothetical protein